MKDIEEKLIRLMAQQPFQGKYPSVAAYQKQVDHFNGRLNKFTLEHPEFNEKITFSASCVPCVGQDTIGECVDCCHFDNDHKKQSKLLMSLSQKEIQRRKAVKMKKRMENLLAFDIAHTLTSSPKEEKCVVVLAENEDRAKVILKKKIKEEVKVIEVIPLGKALFD